MWSLGAAKNSKRCRPSYNRLNNREQPRKEEEEEEEDDQCDFDCDVDKDNIDNNVGIDVIDVDDITDDDVAVVDNIRATLPQRFKILFLKITIPFRILRSLYSKHFWLDPRQLLDAPVYYGPMTSWRNDAAITQVGVGMVVDFTMSYERYRTLIDAHRLGRERALRPDCMRVSFPTIDGWIGVPYPTLVTALRLGLEFVRAGGGGGTRTGTQIGGSVYFGCFAGRTRSIMGALACAAAWKYFQLATPPANSAQFLSRIVDAALKQLREEDDWRQSRGLSTRHPRVTVAHRATILKAVRAVIASVV